MPVDRTLIIHMEVLSLRRGCLSARKNLQIARRDAACCVQPQQPRIEAGLRIIRRDAKLSSTIAEPKGVHGHNSLRPNEKQRRLLRYCSKPGLLKSKSL
jgi:hypothetical protein